MVFFNISEDKNICNENVISRFASLLWQSKVYLSWPQAADTTDAGSFFI